VEKFEVKFMFFINIYCNVLSFKWLRSAWELSIFEFLKILIDGEIQKEIQSHPKIVNIVNKHVAVVSERYFNMGIGTLRF
jgi:hypothetical protein